MDRAQSHQDLLVQIEALLQATHNPPAKLTVAKAQEQFVTELNKKLRAMCGYANSYFLLSKIYIAPDLGG